ARAREPGPHCKQPVPALGPLTYRSEFEPWVLSFSPDGKRLAAGGVQRGAPPPGAGYGGAGKPGEPGPQESGWVKVWDAVTRRPSFAVKGHTQLVHQVVWSPDGKLLASAAADGAIKLWDAAGKEQQAMNHPRVQAIAFGPDGKKLLSGAADGSIK